MWWRPLSPVTQMPRTIPPSYSECQAACTVLGSFFYKGLISTVQQCRHSAKTQCSGSIFCEYCQYTGNSEETQSKPSQVLKHGPGQDATLTRSASPLNSISHERFSTRSSRSSLVYVPLSSLGELTSTILNRLAVDYLYVCRVCFDCVSHQYGRYVCTMSPLSPTCPDFRGRGFSPPLSPVPPPKKMDFHHKKKEKKV